MSSKFLVECILIRAGGTRAEVGGIDYHFSPKNDPAGAGRHVCQIENTAHVQRFLSIPEGYKLAEDLPSPVAAITTPAPATRPAPNQADPVSPAQTPAPADSDGGTGTGEPTTNPAPAPASGLPTEDAMNAMDLEAVRQQFRLEVGREPSAKAKHPSLIAQIIQKRSEAAG